MLFLISCAVAANERQDRASFDRDIDPEEDLTRAVEYINIMQRQLRSAAHDADPRRRLPR